MKRIIFLTIYSLSSIAWSTSFPETNDDSKGLKASGYIDGSYNYLLRTNQFTSGAYDRVFDINPDGVTLQQASLTLAYRPENGFGGLFNPIFGKDAFNLAPYGWDPSLGIPQAGIVMPQGYLQYAQKNFIIRAGEMNSVAGVESVAATKNTNFSRSILWGYAEPFTIFGLRSIYEVNPALHLLLGVDNGWDSLRDTSRRATVEYGVNYSTDAFTVAMAGYSGGQRAADRTKYGPISTRNFIDFSLTLPLTKKFTIVGNYDYGVQPVAALPDEIIGRAVWQGFAGYANYQFNDLWRTSFRGEIFNDQDGYRTGVAQVWKELTLTVGYNLLSNFELRAEARHDFSNVDSFEKKHYQGPCNNQQSFAIEGVAKFS